MGKQQTASEATNVIPTHGTQPQIVTCTSELSVGSIGKLDNGQLWGG